ncbi:hypothetical protein [Miniphocaeibacter massiliensis]|uniref:hypothetical protein n=1 Tax=Miniphocaeibacter massiliensis TaxID=2041841 RepID=UPI000C1C28E1|nr:hypothetical protein [Miniphocaeibacter massiliensis]
MTVLEARRVTLAEFEVMTEAHMLRRVDNQFDIHLQAWANAQAQATDKRGRAYFKTFDKFFDYEKMLKKVKGEDEVFEINKINTDFYKKLSEINKK